MDFLSRTQLGQLSVEAPENGMEMVQGRLLKHGMASLALEDETSRRSFGFSDDPPENLYTLREDDIVEMILVAQDGQWRITQVFVLTPSQVEGERRELWRKRFEAQGDRWRRVLWARQRINQAVRSWFYGQGFLELETPALVPSPGCETHLHAFLTRWEGPGDSFDQNLYLPTSPEFHMKRALVLGYEKIFQLARAFRNGELSRLHQPEFTMLEWYRAYEDYQTIMDDVEAMIWEVAQSLNVFEVEDQGRPCRLEPPWTRMSIAELFATKLKIDLDAARTADELRAQARAQGYDYLKDGEPFEDSFYRLFINELEFDLGVGSPIILYDYPVEMAALSRRKSGAGRYCERFEVYISGVELANAYSELTGVAEQQRRYREYQKRRLEEYGEPYPEDRGLIDAMKYGMPPAAGIALGLDRLAMLLLGAQSVDEVIAFPHKKPVARSRQKP